MRSAKYRISEYGSENVPENLRPEEATLCPLNNLLIYGLRWVIHYHSAVSVVDLCVDTGVTDEIDDPLFTFILVEAESSGEIPGKREERESCVFE